MKEKQREWRENNRERKQDINRQYRENNKEKVSEPRKQWYENNKDKIKPKGKEYRENNKYLIQEQTSVKVFCECGCELRKGDIPRHKKTDKHKRLMEQLGKEDPELQ